MYMGGHVRVSHSQAYTQLTKSHAYDGAAVYVYVFFFLHGAGSRVVVSNTI